VIVVNLTIRSLIARDGLMRDATVRACFRKLLRILDSSSCSRSQLGFRPGLRLGTGLGNRAATSQSSLSWALGIVLALGAMDPGVARAGEVLEFSGPGCLACQRMSPLVEKLKRQGYPIRVIDIQRAPRLARQLDIKLLPTFVLIESGRAVKKIVGVTSERQLRSLAEAARADSLKQPVAKPVAKPVADPGPSVSARLTEYTDSARFKDLAQKFRNPAAGRAAPVVRAKGAGPRATTDSGAGAGAGAGLESSCVRLRLEQSDGHEFASGTIIDSRADRSIILTCGHLFRNYQPGERLQVGAKSAVGMTGSGVRLIVDVFDGRRSTSYAGRLLGHDLESDVGLVEISTRGVLPVAVVADPGSGISAGERLISFGCNGGDRPTRELVAVTRLNRYLGPDNVECTGVPLQGRSGGGLFDSAGRVVGVCFAADPTYQRGLYAGLQPIHDLLTRCHLTSLIANRDQPGPGRDAMLTAARSPVTSNRSLDNVASFPSQPSPQPSPQPSHRLASTTPTVPTVPPRSTSSHHSTGVSRSVSEVAEIQAALSAAAGAEVVCIIRSTSDPRAASRVVIINRASRKFVADLLGEVEGSARRTSSFEVRGSSGSGVSVTSPATAATRMQLPVIRGAGFSVRPGVAR